MIQTYLGHSSYTLGVLVGTPHMLVEDGGEWHDVLDKIFPSNYQGSGTRQFNNDIAVLLVSYGTIPSHILYFYLKKIFF